MKSNPLYPVSPALEKIIKTEQLQNDIGVKAIGYGEMIENYFKETDRLYLLHNLFKSEEDVFCINDDELTNDHIIVGVKSPLFENEKNICMFILPSALSFTAETDDFIKQLEEVLIKDDKKSKLLHEFGLALAKCEIVKYIKLKGFERNNLN